MKAFGSVPVTAMFCTAGRTWTEYPRSFSAALGLTLMNVELCFRIALFSQPAAIALTLPHVVQQHTIHYSSDGSNECLGSAVNLQYNVPYAGFNVSVPCSALRYSLPRRRSEQRDVFGRCGVAALSMRAVLRCCHY